MTAAPVEPADVALAGGRGRIVAIDIVRGFAILWVVLYHLWTDVKYPDIGTVSERFYDVPERLRAGDVVAAATALGDAFLRVGYLGVPLFMALSGLSLTLVAMQRRMEVRQAPRFLYQRLRRVLVPYWFGFAYAAAFALAIAFVQWQRHGGAGYSTYIDRGDIPIDRDQLLAGALIVPRMFKFEWQFAPEGSLWFVALIVQYYLLFPILLAALKRIGPATFLSATFVVTFVSSTFVVAARSNLGFAPPWYEMLAPFRLFEFGLGMTAGYLMVARPRVLLDYTRSLIDVASFLVLGLLLFVGGNLIKVGAGGIEAFRAPMIVLGMSLIALPIVMKVPGRIEASAPGRMLAWVGVISYTVLIVNEPLRSITHTMRVERAPHAWLAFWVVGVYLPLTLAAARPLAVLLGLVQRDRRADTEPSEAGGMAAGAPALRS